MNKLIASLFFFLALGTGLFAAGSKDAVVKTDTHSTVIAGISDPSVDYPAPVLTITNDLYTYSVHEFRNVDGKRTEEKVSESLVPVTIRVNGQQTALDTTADFTLPYLGDKTEFEITIGTDDSTVYNGYRHYAVIVEGYKAIKVVDADGNVSWENNKSTLSALIGKAWKMW
ncbi:hypothetical protein FACS1894142_4810 [Spirochaetia bacterium]|nr:hypothetical protein FACS1894142_4810 [Spirochaetia bacterium]